MTDLWHVGGSLPSCRRFEKPTLILDSRHEVVRECGEDEAASVVAAHNRYVRSPACAAVDLDDDVPEVEAGMLRDEELRREES